MVIDKLRIKNFRGFEELSVEFSPRFNVIIGDNGSGKTALLDGLAVAVSSFFLGIDGVTSRPIHRDDIRLANYENGAEYQLPTEVHCSGTIGSQKLAWSREMISAGGKTKLQKNAQAIKNSAQKLQKEVRDGKRVELPVIAYFPAGRIWESPKATSLVKKGSRLRGYDLAITPTANYQFLTEWFRTKELAALQNGQDLFELHLVRKAVSNCIDQCEKIYYDINSGALVMKLTSGIILPVSRLSDGVRNMMAVVSDIAYRCVTLNPHLGENALDSSGVVLIDELDLHLHPSWQEKIIGSLKDTFPNIQFISTTHSPLILRTVTYEDKIITLFDTGVDYISQVYGRDVDDILRYPMESPIKNPDLEDYFELIEMGEGKSDEAAKLRQKIERQSGPDYHEMARADVLLDFYEEY
jgi:predicted ATP-binding protein involved in virulence